jgi:UMF1 family MFS transporter
MKSLWAKEDRIRIWSWLLYDWANSAFATTVMAGFFPLFFKKYWSYGVDPQTSTLQLGLANSIAALLLAFVAPILGTLADQGGRKKLFLFIFTAIGIAATAGLFVVSQGDWWSAAVLFTIASIGFTGACNFYDSLLPVAAGRASLDVVSGVGYAMGYLGGGLLLVLNTLMYLKPELFGLNSGADGILWSFLSVGIWWAFFSIPLFVFVPEPRGDHPGFWDSVQSSWVQLRRTAANIKQYKNAALFLVAYFFYIDGVSTIMKMAVDYGMALGFDPGALIKALLLVQFVGFPAAIAFGYLGQRFGPKLGIFIGIGVYGFVTFYSTRMTSSEEFYLLALCIGLAQGGVQALSRSFFAAQIPADQSGEFFGFFNLIGKFSSILGPTLMGLAAWLGGDSRNSVLSLLLLFGVGAALLVFVKPTSPAKVT